MIRRILSWTLIVGTVTLALVTLVVYVEWSRERELTPQRWEFYLDVYKAIGTGFLVAILGSVIPQVLPEARDRFERFKDSRTAYSEAKTAVIYLPEQVACMDFAAAVGALHDAHRKLHLAETYAHQLRRHLSAWHPHPETWVDRNYWELMAVRRVLQLNDDVWSSLGIGQRRRRLSAALEAVERVFGRDGERWAAMPRREREARMEQALALLDSSHRLAGMAAEPGLPALNER